MYCQNCGKELPDKAERCVPCDRPPWAGSRYCCSCGAQTSVETRICVRCGFKRPRTMHIRIVGDRAVASAFCLKTDRWQDYLAFMHDAEAAAKSGRARDMNRFLRAALTCLFSHVEGIVNEIYEQKPIKAGRRGRAGLCEKAQAVAVAASQAAETPIPFVNFRLEKVLRDLVVHPGITKAFSDPRSGETHKDQEDVFKELDIETLRGLEQRVSPWLDAVCGALGAARFTDTRGELEKLTPIISALGKAEITEL